MKIKVIEEDKIVRDVDPDACIILFRPTTDEEKKALSFFERQGGCCFSYDEEKDVYKMEIP